MSERQPISVDSVLKAAPGLARVWVTVAWHTTQWTVSTSVRTGTRFVVGALNGETPAQLLSQAGSDVRSMARELLGLTDGADPDRADHRDTGTTTTTEQLRLRAAELLRRSADVQSDEDMHPAYERILDELAPDEARILRVLATEGAQPVVDVRTARPLNIGSELIAASLTMVGLQAGCRHLDRVPSYLNNLVRLGLVHIAREPVDPHRYHVLEAQPEVTAALKQAGRTGKTVRRSLHLTPFGADFCRTCLPLREDA